MMGYRGERFICAFKEMKKAITKRKYAVSFILLFSLLLGCSTSKTYYNGRPFQQTPAQRLAVLPFESSNIYLPGTIFSDYFIIQILQTMSSIQVIERKDLMKILQEQKLTLTGIIRPEKYSKLGSILGVDVVLVGTVQTLETIQSVGGTISVTVKLVEVSSGKILWADNQKISYATWYVREVPEVAESLMKKSAEKIVRRMGKKLAKKNFFPTERGNERYIALSSEVKYEK